MDVMKSTLGKGILSWSDGLAIRIRMARHANFKGNALYMRDVPLSYRLRTAHRITNNKSDQMRREKRPHAQMAPTPLYTGELDNSLQTSEFKKQKRKDIK
jgi:hypothetical protein